MGKINVIQDIKKYIKRRNVRLDSRGVEYPEEKESVKKALTPWENNDSDWEENKHPRAKDGKFTSGSGEKGESKESSKIDVGEAGSAAKYDHTFSDKVSDGARKIYNKALKAEKKISPVVSGITKKMGGRMEGIEYSCKTASSLENKIERKMKDAADKGRKVTDEEIVSGIGDMVRYTSMFSHDDLANKTKDIISELEKSGHKVVQFENFYNHPKAGYKGLHLDVVSPEGQKYELQVHSEESMKVKKQLHPLYEEFRDVKTPPERKREIQRKMEAISAGLKNPKGIDGLSDFRKGE